MSCVKVRLHQVRSAEFRSNRLSYGMAACGRVWYGGMSLVMIRLLW